LQLQHLNSGLFVSVHKTPAPLNPNCRRASLKPGSLAAQFRVLPRFKTRAVGSLVYANEPVLFRSVKHESLMLGASVSCALDAASASAAATAADTAAETANPSAAEAGSGGLALDPLFKLASSLPCCDLPTAWLRLPTSLQRDSASGCEVNGAMEERALTVKVYLAKHGGRARQGMLMTSLHTVRLFHPEGNAFLRASANPDKVVAPQEKWCVVVPLFFRACSACQSFVCCFA
jgi:hypothetical protein